MQSTTTLIPASLDPATRLALANLRAHLTAEGDYSSRAISAIITHVAAEGTLDDAPFVYSSEVDALTEVYVRGFPEVPADDPSWGSAPGQESMFRPADDVVSIDLAELPDAPDHRVTRQPGYWEGLAADGILPAIAGGSDDIPPEYHPSPADWADYHAMMATADYLDGFNAIRPDNS